MVNCGVQALALRYERLDVFRGAKAVLDRDEQKRLQDLLVVNVHHAVAKDAQNFVTEEFDHRSHLVGLNVLLG